MLERDAPFHMRAAVIDGTRYREQPVVDHSRFFIVFGLSSSDEFDKRFRRKTAISHQSAIHAEHRVKQILVMTRQNLEIGTLTIYDRDLGVPPAHIAHAIFHGEDAG